ncbi:hypothetical protein ScPMuIL_010166 [Solemya velum]
MQDQVQALRKHNISAYAIHEGMEKTDISAIKDGTATVLMASPESVITRHWKELIRDTYGDKLCVVAYDEAHCISEWGLEFREDYQKVGILQSLLEAPVLALTATATKEIHKDITRVLGLHEDTKVLATLPDRYVYLQFMGTACGFNFNLEFVSINKVRTVEPATRIFGGGALIRFLLRGGMVRHGRRSYYGCRYIATDNLNEKVSLSTFSPVTG